MKINTSLLALLLLAVQNIAAGLLVEVSRKSPEHSKYSASTVVLMGEFVKLGISIAMLFTGGDSVKRVMATFRSTPLVDSLKLAVPALIYTIQNNLSTCKKLIHRCVAIAQFSRRLHLRPQFSCLCLTFQAPPSRHVRAYTSLIILLI